jgi:hypothetical protein
MINIELYCLRSKRCAIVANENAPTTNRGILGSAWSSADEDIVCLFIITLHAKARNAFMESDG